MYSVTIRRIFSFYHKIDIGMYTHGGCFEPDLISPYTTIGRYCSVAAGVRIINRDHPVHFKSTHAFFFNPKLGWCKEEVIPYIPIEIGSDVWIGHGAVILANVTQIGHGAVISAGAVVNKNVPPYAIVVGNPGRVVRYRFPPEVIETLLASRWWQKDIEELQQDLDEFQRPFQHLTPCTGSGEETG